MDAIGALACIFLFMLVAWFVVGAVYQYYLDKANIRQRNLEIDELWQAQMALNSVRESTRQLTLGGGMEEEVGGMRNLDHSSEIDLRYDNCRIELYTEYSLRNIIVTQPSVDKFNILYELMLRLKCDGLRLIRRKDGATLFAGYRHSEVQGSDRLSHDEVGSGVDIYELRTSVMRSLGDVEVDVVVNSAKLPTIVKGPAKRKIVLRRG